ncbi:hypothetical protein D3C80_1556550 [compost metagenome]
MNSPLRTVDVMNAPNTPVLAVFNETNRAVLSVSILTQGAMFASIQALAAAALDGGDQEQALFRIDLVARQAAEEADRLANAVGTMPAVTSL